MVKAYLVFSNKVLLKADTEKYLEIRKIFFSIAPEYPQLKVLQTDGSVLSKNAQLGVVPTFKDASILQSELQKALPQYVWTIEKCEYPDATDIEWYTS